MVDRHMVHRKTSVSFCYKVAFTCPGTHCNLWLMFHLSSMDNSIHILRTAVSIFVRVDCWQSIVDCDAHPTGVSPSVLWLHVGFDLEGVHSSSLQTCRRKSCPNPWKNKSDSVHVLCVPLSITEMSISSTDMWHWINCVLHKTHLPSFATAAEYIS